MRYAILIVLLFGGCAANKPAAVTSIRLTHDTVRVPAGSYFAVAFSVPQGTAEVVGHIAAIGGSGNDIGAYVLGDDAFTNFVNGHEFRAYFSDEKTSATVIQAGPLPPGSYHLVFDNRFSAISAKTVIGAVTERITAR